MDFHRRDPEQPGLDLVVEFLIRRVFDSKRPDDPRLDEIRRVVQVVTGDGLMSLASNPRASAGVRSRIESALRRLAARTATGRTA